MKSCLIVDDSRAIRTATRRNLEDLNFENSEAVGGRQALERRHERMPTPFRSTGTCR